MHLLHMNTDLSIQIITLASGQRLLRIDDDASGLSLERRLDPAKALVGQKVALVELFQVMLEKGLVRV